VFFCTLRILSTVFLVTITALLQQCLAGLSRVTDPHFLEAAVLRKCVCPTLQSQPWPMIGPTAKGRALLLSSDILGLALTRRCIGLLSGPMLCLHNIYYLFLKMPSYLDKHVQ
jgi:hypothetical protein